MAENTGIDETHDDDLGDEALDRTDGAKVCAMPCGGCGRPSAK